jgi:exonuclease SbcC
MRIESVTLENVKSYAGPTTIEFGEGVHAVLGENGAGKSTIQEAIGFCLFGATPPHANQDELVRDGETSGTVTVEITLDDTRYRLSRKLGGTDPSIINVTEDTELTIDTVAEYEEWLEVSFGLPDSLDLDDLWSNCIGVPQTDFISDFTDSKTDRTDTFDELLGIDAYRGAFKDLKNLPKAIQSDADEILQEINRLDGEVSSLPEDRTKADRLRERVNRLRETVADKKKEKSDIEQQLARRNAFEAAHNQAKSRIAKLEGEINGKVSTVENDIEERAEAQKAQAVVERTEDAYKAYNKAKEELEGLQERREEKQQLVQKRSKKQQRLGELNGSVNEAQSKVDDVESAQQTVARLDHITAVNEAIQRDIANLSLDREKLDAAQETIETAPDEISKHEQEASQLADEIEEIEEKKDTAEQLQSLTEQKSAIEADIGQKNDRIEELEDQIEVIKQARAGGEGAVGTEDEDRPTCPTCGQDLADGGHEELIEDHESTIAELKSEIAGLKEEVESLETDISEARDAQKDVKRLPELRQQKRQAEDDAQEKREDLKEARMTRERLRREQNWAQRLETHREQAITPKLNEYQAAKGTLEDTDDPENPLEAAEQALETAAKQRDDVVEEIQSINDELEAYEGLDEEIERVKDRIEANEEEHTEYENHIGDAEELSERREAVQTAIAELHGVAREHSRTRQYKQLAAARFDADEQHRIEKRKSELSTKIGNLQGTLNTKEANLNELESKIEDLEEKHAERQEKADELRELRRDLAFAKFTRNSIKDAGPKMRELVAGKVSERANEIYQSLRGTGTERLEWDKTYLVTVHDRSHSKAFGQLSGGEKMAAALSIRLALLERLATVDMAFLDEPTKNLDTGKKRNLVNHLETIDTLDQLTVISHDDTFEAMTEFAIQLEKDDETRVKAD